MRVITVITVMRIIRVIGLFGVVDLRQLVTAANQIGWGGGCGVGRGGGCGCGCGCGGGKCLGNVKMTLNLIMYINSAADAVFCGCGVLSLDCSPQDTSAPTWLPRELNVFIKYRTALCVRLLVADLFDLSKVEVLGRTMTFTTHVLGCAHHDEAGCAHAEAAGFDGFDGIDAARGELGDVESVSFDETEEDGHDSVMVDVARVNRSTRTR